jgi:hypothetical protein
MTYTELIKEIQNLSTEDKENLKELIDKYLIEERREAIYKSYQESVHEINESKIKFSDNTDELKNQLED